MGKKGIIGIVGTSLLAVLVVSGCGSASSGTTTSNAAGNTTNSASSGSTGSGSTTTSSSSGQTLTIGVSSDAVNLDPQTTADLTSANVFMNIFDNLVTENKDGQIEPMLATSWKTQGNNWIFNLRQGVKFSNGDPFNATVVKESFARLLDPKTEPLVLHYLKRCRASKCSVRTKSNSS